MTSQIIGLGGGGFTMGDNPLLDLYILAAAHKKNPTVCLLPTASGDNAGLINYFEETFAKYPCETRYLELMCPEVVNMEKFLLDSDIIYVSGGNSKSMLGLWREWGVDKILKKAYEQGTILAGVSAGFVCWFEQCITDSYPKKLSAMPALGFLKGSGCPHYVSDGERGKTYRKLLKKGEVGSGYAAEDGVGLHFVDGKLIRTIASCNDANAFYLYQEVDGTVIEEPIKAEFLGTEVYFNKYITPLFEEISSEEVMENVVEEISNEAERDITQ